jgi:hypothetical protein
MNAVTVKNNNNEYSFNCITGFEEYDHEIVVETDVQIDGLVRGFVGDLFYRTKGTSIKDAKKEVTTVSCFKEVLLARITVSAQPGYAIVWKYNFLKD